MISEKVIQFVEDALDEAFEAHIVPEEEAYPTSGSTFIRVTGSDTDISWTEESVIFVVDFTVLCSIRTRDFVKQNKYKPYKTLIDLQEQTFTHILTNITLRNQLYTLATGISVVGRFTSNRITTRVQKVDPSFYGSKDFSSDREAGYLLQQTYSSPELHIPIYCQTLPPEL
jgi:hypothetical protein